MDVGVLTFSDGETERALFMLFYKLLDIPNYYVSQDGSANAELLLHHHHRHCPPAALRSGGPSDNLVPQKGTQPIEPDRTESPPYARLQGYAQLY